MLKYAVTVTVNGSLQTSIGIAGDVPCQVSLSVGHVSFINVTRVSRCVQ